MTIWEGKPEARDPDLEIRTRGYSRFLEEAMAGALRVEEGRRWWSGLLMEKVGGGLDCFLKGWREDGQGGTERAGT